VAERLSGPLEAKPEAPRSGGGGTDFVAQERTKARAKHAPSRGKIGGAAGLEQPLRRPSCWALPRRAPPTSVGRNALAARALRRYRMCCINGVRGPRTDYLAVHLARVLAMNLRKRCWSEERRTILVAAAAEV